MNQEYRSSIAITTYRAITNLSKIPGVQEQSDSVKEKRLNSCWKNARVLVKENVRFNVADQMIGQLLALSPSDEDGIRPCKLVRNTFMKSISSTSVHLTSHRNWSADSSWRHCT